MNMQLAFEKYLIAGVCKYAPSTELFRAGRVTATSKYAALLFAFNFIEALCMFYSVTWLTIC